MDEDWDLHAVVRGRTATASAAQPNFSSICFRPPATADPELLEIYKPFIFKSPESSQISISPQKFPIINNTSPLSVLPDPTSDQQIIQRLPFTFSNGSKNAVSHTPRPKKRKNDKKRVCHVAAENLSSDVWSWRKYGQKPIKGSPYPRGYYKCSTSKGCPARKQVERNKSNQEMFIVTYTAEHNHPAPTHRNSLAGSTRQKPANSEESIKPHRSPESSPPASLSAVPEKTESSRGEEEADDGSSESQMCLDLEDDFFAGLEDLASPDSAGNVGFPWLSATISEMGAAVDLRW